MEFYQESSSIEPPLELLKMLLKNSFVRSFEADCVGYRMNKRVYIKVQSKVKKFRK
jgi:hypothetical protein